MKPDGQTSTIIFFSVVLLCSLLVITIVCLITLRPAPSTTSLKALRDPIHQSTFPTTTSTFSPEEMQRLSNFQEFLNLPSTHPDPHASRSSSSMKEYMRSVYEQIDDDTGVKRKKRHDSALDLSNQVESILSLPNLSKSQSKRIAFHFDYNASLGHLTQVELILPVKHLSTVRLSSSTFNLVLSPPFSIDEDWQKINLTEYVTSFPLTFYLTLTNPSEHVTALSSGFLTLHFRRVSPFSNQPPVTYPDDPSHCQVRPFRISFAKLRWSAWIVEPRSYEMNVCAGTCHTEPNMATYSIIQNLVHQKYPEVMSAPCCRPKRFSSTVLLYYDGPNLVLKRHENMRVVECACSS